MASDPNKGAHIARMPKKKQRSLRKVKSSFPEGDSGDDEDEGVGLVIRPLSQKITKDNVKGDGADPASIIAARKQKKKEARKIGPSASSGMKPTALYLSTKDDYSTERIKEMAEMNVKVVGSFRRDQADNGGIVDAGFRAPDDVVMLDAPMKNAEDIADAYGEIPNDSYIQKAKQKRERIRSRGGMDLEPAYIPLGPSMVEEGGSLAVDAGFEHDDIADEEFEEWAQYQIRKGMSSGVVRSKDTPSPPRKPLKYREDIKREHGSFSSLSSIDPIVISDIILKDINAQLDSVALTCKQHDQGMKKTLENLASVDEKIQHDEQLLEELDREFIKSQEMKVYISSLCFMLREKSPIIEELQNQANKNVHSRARAKYEYFRTQLDEIRVTACKGVEAGMKILMKGGTNAEAVLASDEALRDAERELGLGTHIPEQLDEFGRDLNAEKRYKIKRRIEKMSRTLGYSSGKHGVALEDVFGGWETDDELERFVQRREDITIECRSLFVDTEDTFSSIEAIRNHLESWKLHFPEQYDATFMGLSAPALFAPFVRLELIDWNPLDPSSTPFNQHHWYVSLFDYGINAPESDPDHNVIPSLVKSVVLPLLLDLCRDVWDPLNVGESRTLAATLDDISVYFDSKGEVAEMFALIVGKLKQYVEMLRPPEWHPSGISTTQRAKTLWRILFKESINLLKSISSLRSLVSVKDFDDVAFESLGKSLMRFIRASILDHDQCLEMICDLLDCLPREMSEEAVVEGYSTRAAFLAEISSVLDALSSATPSLVSQPLFNRATRLLPPTMRSQYDDRISQ